MSPPALQVATTTDLVREDHEVHTVYHGLLRDGPNGREVWRCEHPHPKRPGARACAHGELRQRALPEMRGNWDGMQQRAGRRLDQAGNPVYVPVCPLCAKQLAHTRAEHDRLEAACMRGVPQHA
jgi:hypothetical protein